jgi:hypothetical protein
MRAKEYAMKKTVLISFTLFIEASLSAQNAADFVYEARNGEVTITGYTGSAKNVTIPSRINNLPVTAIGEGAGLFTHRGGKRAGTYKSDDDGKTWRRHQ